MAKNKSVELFDRMQLATWLIDGRHPDFTDDKVLASFLAVCEPAQRFAVLAELAPHTRVRIERILKAAGVEYAPPPPEEGTEEAHVLPKWMDHPGCCKEVSFHVTWDRKNLKKDVFGLTTGPRRDGWSIAYGENGGVNIRFCPFCGKNLATVPPAKKPAYMRR